MALREVSSKQLAAKPWSDVCLLPTPCPTPLAQYSALATQYYPKALCAFASALIGVNLRLKLFAGLAQPTADPSSGGVLTR